MKGVAGVGWGGGGRHSNMKGVAGGGGGGETLQHEGCVCVRGGGEDTPT